MTKQTSYKKFQKRLLHKLNQLFRQLQQDESILNFDKKLWKKENFIKYILGTLENQYNSYPQWYFTDADIPESYIILSQQVIPCPLSYRYTNGQAFIEKKYKLYEEFLPKVIEMHIEASCFKRMEFEPVVGGYYTEASDYYFYSDLEVFHTFRRVYQTVQTLLTTGYYPSELVDSDGLYKYPTCRPAVDIIQYELQITKHLFDKVMLNRAYSNIHLGEGYQFHVLDISCIVPYLLKTSAYEEVDTICGKLGAANTFRKKFSQRGFNYVQLQQDELDLICIDIVKHLDGVEDLVDLHKMFYNRIEGNNNE